MKSTRAINSPLEFEIPNLIDPLFKMTIDTTQSGATNNQSFLLPLQNAVTNMTVYWGDGTSDLITTYNQAELQHGYASSGSYQITLSGSFGGIYFGAVGERLKLSSIDNWGTNQWTKAYGAFNGCSNMVANYTDSPNTSNVTSMGRMFFNCTNFNGALNIDTSNVGDFSYMMYNCINFNQIINFNTSSASNMTWMFKFCSSLNSAFSLSDTSGVGGMSQMFSGCTLFNQAVNFDMANANNLTGMFSNCTNFNQIINFNAPLVTNMTQMFNGCTNFNQSVNITTSSLLTNISYMFVVCANLDSSISISVTSSVTNMVAIFQQCTNFNQPIAFDTSSATLMSQMFYLCSNFNQDISSFNISSLTVATIMLGGTAFSQANYDLLLPAWNAYGTSNVNFTAGNAQYSAGIPATAHAAMLGRGWTITDGGPA